MSKISLNLPTQLVDNLDWLADETETDRTDVIKAILDAVMENGDLIDLIFGEALPDDSETDEEDEDDEEDEEEEQEEAKEPISEQKEGY